jgi:hypothetical protein
MSQGYDFGQLYGQADNSNLRYPEGWVHAVVEDSAFGRTKDGSKGQWTVKIRTTEGEHAGKMPLTQTITISADNPRALGIMFRHLAALGIPVPDPQNPQQIVNGTQPFWMLGWAEEQVAQAMKGRPVQVLLKDDEYEGQVRTKIRDWRAPRPGAPTDWPREQQMAPQQGFAPPPGYGQPQQGFQQAPPQGMAQQWNQQAPPQPQQQGWGAPQGQPAPQAAPQPWNAQQPAQAAPDPYQQATGQPQPPGGWAAGAAPAPGAQEYAQGGQQFPGQVTPQQPGFVPSGPPQQAPVPGAPQWAQPQQPGQPGTGQFTPQGMAQGAQPPQPQQQPQQPPAGWNGNGAPQAQQQPQQAQPQQPGTAPDMPPWAQ